MRIEWLLIASLYAATSCEDDLLLIKRTHEVRLEKYVGYMNAAILHFVVPEDIKLASFRFKAGQIPLSLFNCILDDVTLHLKRGSPPVINPDGAAESEAFLKYGRPKTHLSQFKSDARHNYINITSPIAGSYFLAAFVSYTDPKDAAITQQGLTADCMTFLNAELYVDKRTTIAITTADRDQHVLLPPAALRIYKFHVPSRADLAILTVTDLSFCPNCTELQIRLQPHAIPAPNLTLHEAHLNRSAYARSRFSLQFGTVGNAWYYLTYLIESSSAEARSDPSEFVFRLTHYSTSVTYEDEEEEDSKNVTYRAIALDAPEPIDDEAETAASNDSYTKRSLLRTYSRARSHYLDAYRRYDLLRDGHTESFLYSYDLQPGADGLAPLSVNLTSAETAFVKFRVHPLVDIGGTLQFALAFKPRFRSRRLEEEPEGHVIVACARNADMDVPVWPDRCESRTESNRAPIVVRAGRNASKASNATVLVPYPEPGDWYVSFRLFCGEGGDAAAGGEACARCEGALRECAVACERNSFGVRAGDACVTRCEEEAARNGSACAGECGRGRGGAGKACSSSVVFAVASFPCVGGGCGGHGKCMYLVSEGFAYSTCVCSNGFRGWNCEDASQTTSRAMIMLELLLLVLSNLAFVPTAYVAWRRRYRIEALIYLSTCLFSALYHACDAGEGVYSYCVARLSALQFADFFCGLLAIWVTIVAMADLPPPAYPFCHVVGCIALAFFTAVDKTALWAFAVPFLTGTALLLASWYLHYRRYGKSFSTKRYLFVFVPSGLGCVCVGLLMYALLQTQSNYKFLHSLWHVLMALSVVLLLPREGTFVRPREVAADESDDSSSPSPIND